MTVAEFDNWCSENQSGEKKTAYYNGINYTFVEMADGWIAVFRYNNGYYIPIIQADTMAHAEGYCGMLEPVTVPLIPI